MNTIFLLDAPDRDRHFHHYVLNGLENAGFHPIVVYCTGKPETSWLSSMGHRSTGLNLSSFLYKNFNPFPVIRLIQLIRSTNAKLVHVQRHRPLIYAGIACRLTRTPMLYSIRATKLVRNTNRRFAFNRISPALEGIIAVSNGAKEDFIKHVSYPNEQIYVVFNGIDIEEYRTDISMTNARRQFAIPERAILFGMAARFKKAKDHSGLITAFKRVVDKMRHQPETAQPFLALAGDGPREELIRTLAADYGIMNRMIFTGKIEPPAIPLFLRALDIFVHPSFREGMPAAVLEAMAAGLPVISTDAEGVTDIFHSPLDFGRMVRTGDVNALTDAMLELALMEPEKRKEMGINGAKRLRQGFTREQMVQGTVEIYMKLCYNNDDFVKKTIK